jgi:hypothetical protein
MPPYACTLDPAGWPSIARPPKMSNESALQSGPGGGRMTKRSHPAASPDGGGEGRMTRRRATTVAPEGRLVLAESAGNSRLFIYMLGNYLHRIERERRTVYCGDLDLARVAEIIGAAGVEPGMRDAAFRVQHGSFDSIVGVEGQRAVNATSIASASGIPRETVRRKLKRLEARLHRREGPCPLRGEAGPAAAAGLASRLHARHSTDRAVHERVSGERRGALGRRQEGPAKISAAGRLLMRTARAKRRVK